MDCDVFISYKHSDADTPNSRDYVIAHELYSFLSARNIRTFFSSTSLEGTGVGEYKRTIDDALDAARILIVVGTSVENITSQWVRYEWDGFLNDILSGFKLNGRVFAYIEGITVAQLPFALRHIQVFRHSAKSLDALYGFVASALGKETQSEIDWLLSVRESMVMLNRNIADRIEPGIIHTTWVGMIPALALEAWNMGHALVDVEDMRAELLKRESHDISQRQFDAGVHAYCIPGSAGKPNDMHYLLYTPMPHLRAINVPVLFESWYADTGHMLRTIFPFQQAPRPVGGGDEKQWCEWLQTLRDQLNPPPPTRPDPSPSA